MTTMTSYAHDVPSWIDLATPDPAVAMMLLAPEMVASGMPPVWSVYVTVDDIDAAVARVDSAGATLLDPHGAAFSIMQPAS